MGYTNFVDEANFINAKSRAESLLTEFGYTSPPVSPVEVAERLGLRVLEVDMLEDFEDVAGFIDMDKKTIYVNKMDSPSRKSFTIAHEIGHYVLHEQKFKKDPSLYQVLFRTKTLKDQENSPEEKEANYFAASLLVPLDQLKKYKNLPSSVLGTIFGVSQEVIEYRKRDMQWHLQ